MPTDEQEAARIATAQKRDLLFILSAKFQPEQPSWCKEVVIPRFHNPITSGNDYIKIIGHINVEKYNQHWWDAEAFVWTVWCRIDEQKRSWYYGLRFKILQITKTIPDSKIGTATTIKQTKFYTAQSLLDAMQSFYQPLQSLDSLTNIHEHPPGGGAASGGLGADALSLLHARLTRLERYIIQ